MTRIPANRTAHEIPGCEKTHSHGDVGTTKDFPATSNDEYDSGAYFSYEIRLPVVSKI